MADPLPLDARQTTERFFTMIKSLDEFDRLEVRPVIDTLLFPSRREQCFIGTYRRSVANIATLQELKSAKHFQTVAMLARALFELAVDIRLIDVVPDSCLKMIEFVDLEKLRSARKIIRFKGNHPNAKMDTTIYDSFVGSNEKRIEGARRTLWTKAETTSHWSGLKLAGRVKLLNPLFEEIYEVHYPHLSWQVHSGLTGIVNLKAETFTFVCARGFKLAADSYWETLCAVIDEFKIEKANRKIKRKMKAAKLLPFTDSPDEADVLRELCEAE